MEQKTDKRIVTKGAYVKAKGKRESFRFVGVCLLLCSGTLGFITVCMVGVALNGLGVLAFIPALCFGILTFCLGKWGFESIQKSRTIDPGIPLTRANTANLPAPDSLVRASEEPTQAQEAVLLRATAEGQATPPEQLVRAVQGQD